MYHAIEHRPDDPNRLGTSPELFEMHMRYLKRRKLRGVSMRELRRAVSAGEAKGLVGLTFDDGYKDFLYVALPVLERVGFSATVFVVAGKLGGENDWKHHYEPKPWRKLLEGEEIREVSQRGMEVGAHSMSHAVLPSLEPGVLDEEVSGCRRILSKMLDEVVEGFCYPYGIINDASVRAVRKAGYTYACSVSEQVTRDDYDLTRVTIGDKDHSALRFGAKIEIYRRSMLWRTRIWMESLLSKSTGRQIP